MADEFNAGPLYGEAIGYTAAFPKASNAEFNYLSPLC